MKDKEEGRRSYRDSSSEAPFGKDGTPHAGGSQFHLSPSLKGPI